MTSLGTDLIYTNGNIHCPYLPTENTFCYEYNIYYHGNRCVYEARSAVALPPDFDSLTQQPRLYAKDEQPALFMKSPTGL
ncbi:hypothetical protein LSAT2_003237 [Lamellibrachia satsuma]|nr:hypothetical protein LSAT2_003237 [Lamellibrachia satsuma]